MTVETKNTLTDETISKLQKLIRANVDSFEGFRECAKEIDDRALAELFSDLATERSKMAAELQNYVTWNGEEAVDDGSLAAGVHRAWINVRGKLSGGDAYVILSEAERGEDSIKEAYEDVLKETAGTAMNDVLQSQYASVKAAHDRIRHLRDTCKSMD